MVGYWWNNIGNKVFSQKLKSRNTPARMIDLEPVGGNRFAAALFKTPAHSEGWWWYVGQTAEEVKKKKDLHKARIVSLESYKVGGKTRYAIILVRKQGQDNRKWWYYRMSLHR